MERRFRTALNGFNRSDVADYIESSAARYEQAISELRVENGLLREELEQLRAAPAPAPAEEPVVETPSASQELEAYRRAEAVERNARQRADRLCKQVNGLLEHVSGEMGRSSSELESLTDAIRDCLRQLADSLAEFQGSIDALGLSEEETAP